MTTGPTGRCSAARETRECVVCGWRRFDPLAHDDSLVCPPCENRMTRWLHELTSLSRLLPAVVEPSRGAEYGIPLRLDAVDLGLPGRLRAPSGDRDDQIGYAPITSALAEWIQAWHEAGAPDPLRYPDDPQSRHRWPLRASTASIGSVTMWLRVRLGWACAHFYEIGEFARAIRRQLSAVRRVLNVDLSPTRFDMPCPHCGTQTLTRQAAMPPEPGEKPDLRDPWIECSSCGRLWSDGEYQAAKVGALRAAIPDTALLTASQIAIARPVVPARRVRVWAHRGKLQAIPGPWGGRTVYLLADVDGLLFAADEREAVAA